jgi:probable rRNA maturation factor
MNVDPAVIFENSADQRSSRALQDFIACACKAVGLGGSVNVLVATDSKIRRLNHHYRGKNMATDVLSFPAGESSNGVAGDIAISREIAAANARALGHSLMDEIRILILHGILHLAGYDHENDQGVMQRKETALRKKLGLPDALIERSLASTTSSIFGPSRSAKSRSRQRRRAKDERRSRT